MGKRSDEVQLPEVGEGKRGEAGHLGYLLRQAAGAFRHQMDRALADLGVTPPQFAVMTMLAAYPGISNADIARLALLTPQTVSVIIANLERAGAIQRAPHSVHGRILQIELTEAGRSQLKACRERVEGLERELAEGMSEVEEAVVRAWLVRVARG
ncbi:MarR family winged helix-turn-helix transcriptional regulator [Pleomorphomonas oryzae]|uniref:MarR family winged helix-turn-helix transcriptional regulator n=1 Tax=Pleomorphomonas oryzae TaxID=261934 RepID=UPI000410A782|nr:MarR family transcriptional regulator [Pleomorphomonas oryzae]